MVVGDEAFPLQIRWKGMDDLIRAGATNDEIRGHFGAGCPSDSWLQSRREWLNSRNSPAQSAAGTANEAGIGPSGPAPTEWAREVDKLKRDVETLENQNCELWRTMQELRRYIGRVEERLKQTAARKKEGERYEEDHEHYLDAARDEEHTDAGAGDELLPAGEPVCKDDAAGPDGRERQDVLSAYSGD